ncbi:MAG TPA: hypothetical protein VGI95_15775 [Caulobacteraceae bacterium]|jgi:hypothetical protein
MDAKEELEALWTAVFGQPPVVDAEPDLLAQLIVQCSAPPPLYGEALPGVHAPDDDGVGSPEIGKPAGVSQASR